MPACAIAQETAIALFAHLRILLVLLLIGGAVYVAWRVWARAARDPVLRQRLSVLGGRLLRSLAMRGGVVWLLLRALRWFR